MTIQPTPDFQTVAGETSPIIVNYAQNLGEQLVTIGARGKALVTDLGVVCRDENGKLFCYDGDASNKQYLNAQAQAEALLVSNGLSAVPVPVSLGDEFNLGLASNLNAILSEFMSFKEQVGSHLSSLLKGDTPATETGLRSAFTPTENAKALAQGSTPSLGSSFSAAHDNTPVTSAPEADLTALIQVAATISALASEGTPRTPEATLEAAPEHAMA